MIHARFNVVTRSRSYPVVVGEGILEQAREFIEGVVDRVFVVTDDTVSKLYLGPLVEGLDRFGLESLVKIIPSGERSKSLQTGQLLYEFLEENIASRSDTVFALGGGVVGDLAGFIASTFKRGMHLVQLPTTLLAQVDSSLGGKNGVNLCCGKNLVGTFYQPHALIVDVHTLKTLTESEYTSGLAEVVKYAVTMDKDLIDILIDKNTEILGREPETMIPVIERCLRNKARVIIEDETEDVGRREVLNYGHTVGHAVETLSNHSLSHGQAVAIGMVQEARLAVRMGLLDSHTLESLILLLSMFGLPTDIPPNIDLREIETIVKQDKKMRHGHLNLPILIQLGRTQVTALDPPLNLIS
jgi:3-dehydroquinate synthase